MQLNFEIIKQESIQGSKFNYVHFWDNQVQVFYINNNKLYTQTAKIYNGEWENLEFVGERQLLATDENISDIRISGLYGNIVVGTYTTNKTQKMFVYEY